MNQTARILLCLAAGALCLGTAAADESSQDDSSSRTIHLKQDDAQVRFDSRVYELKNVTSEAILPFVNSAIQRYSRSSTIRRVTAIAPDAKDAILVSTGREFLPYVDEIVAALDRPGQTPILSRSHSSVQGSACHRCSISDDTCSPLAGRTPMQRHPRLCRHPRQDGSLPSLWPAVCT